jgi:hypothetical protein
VGGRAEGAGGEMRFVKWLVRIALWPSIREVARDLKDAPICHGEAMELIGVHESLFSRQQTYQCQTCKRIEQK